jgi:hypothetical protein
VSDDDDDDDSIIPKRVSKPFERTSEDDAIEQAHIINSE